MQRDDDQTVEADHESLGKRSTSSRNPSPGPPETVVHRERHQLRASLRHANTAPYVKDAFHRHLVHGEKGASTPPGSAPRSQRTTYLTVPPKRGEVLRLRLPPQRRTPGRAKPPSRLPTSIAVFTAAHQGGGRVLPGPAVPAPPRRWNASSCARPTRACSGPSSSTTTSCGLARGRSRRSRSLPRNPQERAQLPTGVISSTATSSRCPTSGSTPGSRPGTSPST
jgi:hypothetical protein